MQTRHQLVVLIAFASLSSACADDPAPTTADPVAVADDVAEARRIHLKLPLANTQFHWVFASKQKLLDGKLIVSIRSSDGKTQVLVPFKDGVLSEDWAFLDFPNKLPDDKAYFGLKSKKRFQISVDDRVTMRLTVIEDLDGEGPDAKGTLKADTYTSSGRFTLFPAKADADRVAFIGDKPVIGVSDPATVWTEQWPLLITSDEGWMKKPTGAPSTSGTGSAAASLTP